MSTEDLQKNNPLHGVSLEQLLTELVTFYGFDILAEYTRLNCFKNRPSLNSSLKFLKKTEWAREKLERFYLYTFKNLPQADDSEFDIPPRQRLIPMHHKPKAPKKLLPGQAPLPKADFKKKPTENILKKDNPTKDKSSSTSKKTDEKTKDSNSADPYANSPR